MLDLQAIPKRIAILIVIIILSVWPTVTDWFDIGNIERVTSRIHMYASTLSAAQQVIE